MGRLAKWALLVGLVVVASLLVSFFSGQGPLSPDGDGQRGVLLLTPPVFAQAGTAHFPAVEAGVAAYLKLDRQVELDKVRDLFRGIRAQGEKYLIGVIELTGLPEEAWPHLYVDTEGWILGYYSKYDPTSKLVYWGGYEGGPVMTTTLREAIKKFAVGLFTKLLLPFDFATVERGLRYYHFKYPDATQLLLAVDAISIEGSDSFRYAIPQGVVVREMSWAHYTAVTGSAGRTKAVSRVEGRVLYETPEYWRRDHGPYFGYGMIEEPGLMTADFPRTVTVTQSPTPGGFTSSFSGVAIAFVYR